MDMNPQGTVPVLSCYGGAVIIPDSESILEYIVRGKITGPNGNKLALKEGEDPRYESAKEWRQFITNDIISVSKSAVLGNKTSKKELFELLRNQSSKIQGPFLCGEDVTVADCAAFPFLWRINSEYGPLDKIDGCEKWAQWLSKCEAEPAFQKSLQSSWWWWW